MRPETKWQPLMGVVENGRIQCQCGALAVILCARVVTDHEEHLHLQDVSFWCQPCYTREIWPDDKGDG